MQVSNQLVGQWNVHSLKVHSLRYRHKWVNCTNLLLLFKLNVLRNDPVWIASIEQ